MNTQYKQVYYEMVKEHVENLFNKQFSWKAIQRYTRQFRCDSQCSERNYNVFLFLHCSRFDIYLICDCSISKDAVEFALSFYGFGFRKRRSCNGEICKILIEENQLRLTVYLRMKLPINYLGIFAIDLVITFSASERGCRKVRLYWDCLSQYMKSNVFTQ